MAESHDPAFVKRLGFEHFRQTRRRSAASKDPFRPVASQGREADHALGALYGAVIGNSLGRLTQGAPASATAAHRSELEIDDADRAERLSASGLVGDSLTAEASLLLGVCQLVVAGNGHLTQSALACALTGPALEGARLHDPYLRRAKDLLEHRAESGQSDRWGDTDGAAVLALPLGIATPGSPLSRLVGRVEEACQLTHHSGRAIAGASALAGAVSVALTGTSVTQALAFGRRAAEASEQRRHGHHVPGASVAERIDWSLQLIGNSDTARARGLISTLIGTGGQMQEAIPAAFALALMCPDDPWRVCLEAARVGGDSATIGLLAGSIVGAVVGVTEFPSDVLGRVDRASTTPLGELARRLTSLRSAVKNRGGVGRGLKAPSTRHRHQSSKQPDLPT